jgi:hypothetical protein
LVTRPAITEPEAIESPRQMFDTAAGWDNFRLMRVTIDIPDKLAEQLEPERERMAEIIARGMRRSWSGTSNLRRAVISFLARTPTAKQIIEFRPPEIEVQRLQELLRRNKENLLTPEEEAELDDMCEVDRFVSLIQTEVLQQTSGQA